jgi:cysteine desulfuration protein SufE
MVERKKILMQKLQKKKKHHLEIKNKIESIKDTLESLKIGNMELHYLVDLGKESRDTFPEEDRVEENFIHGCTSYAWIKLESPDPIQIKTVSDSMIVGGILALLEQVFNGEPKSSIDPYEGQDLIDGLGLDGHISSQRLRGFAEAVRMMKQ